MSATMPVSRRPSPEYRLRIVFQREGREISQGDVDSFIVNDGALVTLIGTEPVMWYSLAAVAAWSWVIPEVKEHREMPVPPRTRA